MSCTWICTSCRRTLQQQARRAALQHSTQRAAYIPFQNSSEEEYCAEDVEQLQEQPRRVRHRRAPGYIDWQFDKSVENDFLQRISENRAPRVGPYSRHRKDAGNSVGKLYPYKSNESNDVESSNVVSSSDSARIYKRNITAPKAHPLEVDETAQQKRPWFGIPSSHTAFADLAHVIPGPSSHRYLNSSLGLTASLPDTSDDGGVQRGVTLGTSPSPARKPAGHTASFFDQYFEQAREEATLECKETPLQKAIAKLQTAHHLAIPQSYRTTVQRTTTTLDEPDIFEDGEAVIKSSQQQTSTSTISYRNCIAGKKQDAKAEDANRSTTTKSSIATQENFERPSEMYKNYLRLTHSEKRAMSQRAMHKLCQSIVCSWCVEGQAASRVPKPVKLLQTFHQWRSRSSLALLSVEVLWTVVSHTIPLILTGRNKTVPADIDLLSCVLELWASILQNFADCYVRDQGGTIQQLRGDFDWHLFNRSEQMQELKRDAGGSIRTRLFSLFSPELHSALRSLDAAALSTWALVDSSARGSDVVIPSQQSSQVEQACSFFRTLALGEDKQVVPYEKVFAKRCLHRDDKTTLFERLIALTQANDEQWPITAIDPSFIDSQDKLRSTIELFNKRISRAIEAQDVTRLERIWQKLQFTFKAMRTVTSECAEIAPPLYARLLTGFMALGRPNRAIDIWNSMTTSGLDPSVEHWDAMLKGCGIARDAEAVQAVWKSLQDAGVKPDAQLWATRIHSLGSAGRIEAAVQAFQTMAREWAQAESVGADGNQRRKNVKTDSSIPKPNTQCLNALVGLLSRANRHQQLIQVLSWRKALDIPADSFTYNPLLKAALRDGDTGLASNLVEQMRSQGVNPDIATFTMMLDSAFQQQIVSQSAGNPVKDQLAQPVISHNDLAEAESVDPLQVEDTKMQPPRISIPAVTEQQQSAVETIFGLMEQQDLKPTAHTFTTIVSGLLRSEPPNAIAAYGILQHLSSRSIPVPPQIYTALVSYNFELDPPNFEAVDALWHDANRRRRGGSPPLMDTVFYSRVIEGLATHGETSRALQAMNIARNRGKDLSWDAMRALMESLARAGEWSEAQKLLDELTGDERNAGADETRGRRGYAAFWDTVTSLGIVDVLKARGTDIGAIGHA